MAHTQNNNNNNKSWHGIFQFEPTIAIISNVARQINESLRLNLVVRLISNSSSLAC